MLQLPPFPDATPLVVEVTRPSLISLVETISCPNVLTAAVDRILIRERDEGPEIDLKELANLYLGIAHAAIGEPALLEFLTYQQADALWRWLIEGACSLIPFVQSSKFFSLALTCKRWGTSPAAQLRIEDEYTAYCVDDAASFLLSQIEMGNETTYLHEVSEREKDRMSRESVKAARTRIRKRESH